jgi:uncharacterized protein
MVFIGWPRQVGKTTLARDIGASFKNPTYLNWDSRDDRAAILSESYHGGTELVIFDEIHKFKDWKNYIKGVFDTRKDDFAILVTGSARLDLYQKWGDSLLGRYFYYRLHPLSIAELLGRVYDPDVWLDFEKSVPESLWQDLIQFWGFPEMYTARDTRDLKRWHNDREKRIVQEDIRDMSTIRDLSRLELLAGLLPERVGSLFSINSLVEDLRVTHATISTWMDVLEQSYFCYRLYPHQSSKIKSLRKEPKVYMWDYTGINSLGAKYENIVANHLLKYVHFLTDVYGLKAELQFLRDIEQREVDFCVVVEGKIEMIVEVKSKKSWVAPALQYFYEKLGRPPAYQLVFEEGVDIDQSGIRIMSASKFLSGLV